jgi:hypothetical protein
MGFIVIYDASVLYPPTLRDVLIRVAQEGMVHAKWTNRILDETDSWRNPPGTVSDVLDRLERTGLVETAARLRLWKSPGWQ